MSAQTAKLAVLMLVTTANSAAQASGYAINERDAAGLGRAFAGQAAVTGAASLSVNPAALPQALTIRATLSGLANDLTATDADGGSTQGGEDALIPAAYGSWKGAGIGLDAPFGLSTSYPKDWSGRGAAVASQITSARLTIGAGGDLAPGLRLGAAVFAQYFSAELSSVVLLAPSLEGHIQVDGSDIGLGIGIGGLWRPSADLTLGIGYTSPVWHELSGDADLPPALGRRANTSVKVVTPESIRLGLDWRAADRWRLLAGAEWTRWSRLESLDIDLSNGLRLSEEHAWRDTWRFSLGGEHQRGRWTMRSGVAWDQSPVSGASHRYPRLPDADRTWLALGLGYRTGPWQLDAGLAKLIFSARDGEHPPLTYRSDTTIAALGLTRTW